MWYFKVANGCSTVDLQKSKADAGDVGQPIRSGEPSCMSTTRTAQESQLVAWLPIFVSVLLRGWRLWTISFQRKTDSAIQGNGVRARWFHGLRRGVTNDLQQISQTAWDALMSLVRLRFETQPTSGSIETRTLVCISMFMHATGSSFSRIRARFQRKGNLPRHSRPGVDIGAGENGLSGLVRQSDYVFSTAVFLLQGTALGSCRRDTN